MVRELFYKSAREYYDRYRDVRKNEDFIKLRDRIYQEANDYREKNPGLSMESYRAFLYPLIAENFVPQIHSFCPFYFEMGLKDARSIGGGPIDSVGMWGVDKEIRRARNIDYIKRFGYADGENIKDFIVE